MKMFKEWNWFLLQLYAIEVKFLRLVWEMIARVIMSPFLVLAYLGKLFAKFDAEKAGKGIVL